MPAVGKPGHRAVLGFVVAATLPRCHPTASVPPNAAFSSSISTDTLSTPGSFDEPLVYPVGAGVGGAKGNAASTGSGSTPLLNKYTYRETVRTVIEEDQLPELPAFLEGIGLGDRIEVRHGNIEIL